MYNGVADRRHEGLVISSTQFHSCDIRALVLDLHVLRTTKRLFHWGVHTDSFKLTTEEENTEEHVQKNLRRRLATPLNFGDVIVFEAENTRLDGHDHWITRFERATPEFEVNCNHGKTLICLQGVVNPNDRTQFWNDVFDDLSIDEEVGQNVVPNIFINAWIAIDCKLKITKPKSVNDFQFSYKFDSFGGVCPVEDQFNVGNAPWNKFNAKYHTFSRFDSDEEDDDCFNNFATDSRTNNNAGPALEIVNEQGFVTGTNSFYLIGKPQFYAVFPVLNTPVQLGDFYVTNAIWNPYEKYYMIDTAKMRKKIDENKQHKRAKIDINRNLLRTSIKAVDGLPGVYQSDDFKVDGEFGFIDDPMGVLSLIPFSPYADKSIQVDIFDGKPGRGGAFRFRVLDLFGDRKEKLANWVKSACCGEGLWVQDVIGYIVDERTIFSTQYPSVLFRTAGFGQKLPYVGTCVRFSAEYSYDKSEFQIRDWSPDQIVKPIRCVQRKMLKHVPAENQWLFFIKAARLPQPEFKLNHYLICDELGLLDDHQSLIPKLNRRQTYGVWVMLAQCRDTEQFPTARARFEVVSAKEAEPANAVEEPVIVPEAIREMQELVNELRDMRNGRVASRVSTNSAPLSQTVNSRSRFSGPRRVVNNEDDIISLKATSSRDTDIHIPMHEMNVSVPPPESREFGSEDGGRWENSDSVLEMMFELNAGFRHTDRCQTSCDPSCQYKDLLAKELLKKRFSLSIINRRLERELCKFFGPQ